MKTDGAGVVGEKAISRLNYERPKREPDHLWKVGDIIRIEFQISEHKVDF